MEDLLKFGLKNGIFKPEYVMNLFYGNLSYHSRKIVATNDFGTFCKWDAYCNAQKNWRDIPLKQRMEIIALTIKQCAGMPDSNTRCFHDRMLCLMHELLNDNENRVECVPDSTSIEDPKATKYGRYDVFIYPEMRQSAVTEMFLWWHMGVRKSDEERRLLKKCWVEFLGFDRPLSQKNTIGVVEQTIEEFESELTEVSRIMNVNNAPIRKRNVCEKKKIQRRLQESQRTQAKCLTALAFLKGYQDFVLALAKLKP